MIKEELMSMLRNELPVLRARLGISQAKLAEMIGISKIVQMNKKNESKRLEFYEQYVSGKIDADEYQRMIERVSVVEKELLARQKEIEKSSKMTEKLCKKNYLWLSEFTKGINTEYLTKESVSAYINKITLYEDKRIEIEFKLQDELLELAKKLKEGVVRCQMISA